MVDKNGQVKVMDFGLARRVEAGEWKRSPRHSGVHRAGNPGQWHLIDHRADIYALGIVFQQMLTGNVPRSPVKSLAEHGNFDPAGNP